MRRARENNDLQIRPYRLLIAVSQAVRSAPHARRAQRAWRVGLLVLVMLAASVATLFCRSRSAASVCPSSSGHARLRVRLGVGGIFGP